MELTDSDIEKLQLFAPSSNGCGYIYWDGKESLYKIIDFDSINSEYSRDMVERNIDFLIHYYHKISNYARIYEKIYIDKMFAGYRMKYLENTVSFRNASGVDIANLTFVIHDIYQTIKFIHKNGILFGDINMDSFLLDRSGNGDVVDLDYLVFPEDKLKIHQHYYVRLGNDSSKLEDISIRTDNIKAMICCFSLMLGVDLEKECQDSVLNIENIYDKYIKELHISALDDYFRWIIVGKKVEYFDEFLLNHVVDFLESGKMKIKKRL